VTIKQLNEAEQDDDGYKVDGAALHYVKIIGTINTQQESSTNFQYFVSDGTGTIVCKKWIDQSTSTTSNDYLCK